MSRRPTKNDPSNIETILSILLSRGMIFYYFPLNQTLRVVANDYKEAVIYYVYLIHSD